MRFMYIKPTKKRLGDGSNLTTKRLRMDQAYSKGFFGYVAQSIFTTKEGIEKNEAIQ